MAPSLADKKCVPCEGGTQPLGRKEAGQLLGQVGKKWSLLDGRIRAGFKFADFKEAMSFVNRVADLAEGEGHHPDIEIRYNNVKLVLWTHAAGGLTENDFILAAKINRLLAT